MKYDPDERFEGHLSHLDPRTPVTAAGCCTWPTIPAHKYILGSPNAWGVYVGLTFKGMLMVKDTVGPAHDLCSWNMVDGPAPITFAVLRKRYNRPDGFYTWELDMSVTGCSGIQQKERIFDCGPCNVDFLIGNIECSGLPGGTGSGFFARQVEWDKTNSPNPWPPPT